MTSKTMRIARSESPRVRFAPVICWVAALGLAASYAAETGSRVLNSEQSPEGPIGAIISLRDTITDVSVSSVERRMAEARAQGAKVVIIELDTPGGLVTSATAIADAVKKAADIHTVAWVNPSAISGGALVAVACGEIVTARSCRFGDSQVIMLTPQGMGAVPEDLKAKAYSPVLKEFREAANTRGYSPILSEAFVIPEREVWWLEHIETGRREFVFKEEKAKRLHESSSVFSVSSSPNVQPEAPEWKLVETYFDIVADKELPLCQPIERENELLTMSASEAHAFGFSKGLVNSEDELRQRYGLSRLLRFDANWSESLAHWLTSFYVRGFLMVIILLSTYVEFHSPGLGLAGLVALIALVVLVGAPYLTGLANVWEILFIFGGIALVLVEVFVIPGFGIAGISGLVLITIGLLATFAPPEPGRTFPLFIPSYESTMEGLKQGLMMIVGSMLVSLVGMVMMSRYLPRMPLLKAVIPANPTPSEVLTADPYSGAARIGDFGEAIGPLRPAGKAQFGEVLVDVVTGGEYLERGARLEVIERRGNRVVVRAVT